MIHHEGGVFDCVCFRWQCENKVVSFSPVRRTVVDEGEQGKHEDDEDDDEHHVVTKTRELAKHVRWKVSFHTKSLEIKSLLKEDYTLS